MKTNDFSVISTESEPVPGWIDNFYGIIGIVVVAALGVLRTLRGKKDYIAYVVPCDYVSNTVLASIWDIVTNKYGVYNSETHARTP